MAGLRIDVLTLFPGIFHGFLNESMLRRAVSRGVAELHFCDWRAFTTDRHGSVDDVPYGGGPGMVLCPGPIFAAVEDLGVAQPQEGVRRILLSPQGRTLSQGLLSDVCRAQRLVLVCGRYEGFDERVRVGLGFEEVSLGDYVIAGGEVAAMVIIEGVVRLLPGALGATESTREESFQASPDSSGEGSGLGGLLEYPQYTRPPVFRGMAVPDVLQSGDHARIAQWRRDRAQERTRRRRPDVWERLRERREANGGESDR